MRYLSQSCRSRHRNRHFRRIVTSAKLTNYRLQQLEKKVDKHNQFAERLPVLEEKIRAAGGRISNLEMAVGLAKTKM